MHALGLLLIIAFIIFIVPIIGIFQLILRFFFGKKNSVKNPFGQQGQKAYHMVHPYEKEQKGYPRRRRRIYRFRRYKREIDNKFIIYFLLHR